MSEFSKSIAEQVEALEKDHARHKRDSEFYHRLLVQLAMMNGGTIKIDPAFGEKAIAYSGSTMMDSQGFHVTGIWAKP